MTRVALETVGCRLNQYETEWLADQLVGMGLKRVRYDQEADLYILNSCTVTGKADADCRKLINRANRKNRQAIMVVTGCYADSEKENIMAATGVDLIVGNAEKEQLPEILLNKFPELFESKPDHNNVGEAGKETLLRTLPNDGDPDFHLDYPKRNRALVKIGDGCDQDCTYCIVPRVRGRLRSIAPDQIIADVKRRIDEGYREVVLTAVHIGRYYYMGMNLAGLVQNILDETTIGRLRLSSLEPNELDDPLLDLVAHHPRLCRHLHLPLQSGSDRILGLMRRPYTRADYLKIVDRVKQANPDITVGCDLIVGFPGETDEDFEQSLGILLSGAVDYQHVFSYSDRPGTPASQLPGKVALPIVRDRNRRVREIGRANRRRQMQTQVGKTLGIISENKIEKEDFYWGISDNYLKVKILSSSGGAREIVNMRIDRLVGDHLEGVLI